MTVRPNMPLVWLLLLVDVVVSSLGSIFAKWYLAGSAWWAAAAMLTYSAANATWIGMLRSGAGQLARMGVLCDLSNCLAVVTLGVVAYHERLTPRHSVGLVVALAGIFLLGGGD